MACGLKDCPDGPNPGKGPVRRAVDGTAALVPGFGPGAPPGRFVNGVLPPIVLPPIVMDASLAAFFLLVHAILASVANGVDRLVVQLCRKAVRGRRGAAPPSGGAPSLRPQGHFDEHP